MRQTGADTDGSGWSRQQEEPGRSADFDDVGGGCRGGVGAFHELLCDVEELCRLRAFRAGERNRKPAVATFANCGNEFDGTEERNFELSRGALCAASREDVDRPRGSADR